MNNWGQVQPGKLAMSMDLNILWNEKGEEIKVQWECKVDRLWILHFGLKGKHNVLFQYWAGYPMVNPTQNFLSAVKKEQQYEN